MTELNFGKNILSKQNLSITFRRYPVKNDFDNVYRLLEDTGFFSNEELNTAIELIDEKLQLGNKSTYKFVFAESGNRLVGYTCYGLVPLTKSSYDLYWIGVDTAFQGNGIGHILMSQTEISVKKSGGSAVYADTSSREQYSPTRRFYLSCGFREAAYFKDFYAPGDGKIVFVKELG
ncbi:MAG: GNAT family N-acetyltransferase [Spirochaetes bacterium]|nr:GNAT family N-acetyltransferase [Spirochaetota bacterium]